MNKLYNLNNLYVALISYKTNSDIGDIVKYTYTIIYKDNHTYNDIYNNIDNFNIISMNKIKDSNHDVSSTLAMKIAKINGSYAKLNNSDYNLNDLYTGEITDYMIKGLDYDGAYTGELRYFNTIVSKNNNSYFDIMNNRVVDGITVQHNNTGNHIYDSLDSKLVKLSNENKIISAKKAYNLALSKKLIRK